MYQVKHTFIHTVDQSEADRIRMLRRTQSESCNLAGGSTASTQCEVSGDSGEDNLNGRIRGCLSPVSSSMGGSPRVFVEDLLDQKTGGFDLASCEATTNDKQSGSSAPELCPEEGKTFSSLAAELLAYACEGSMKLEPDSVDVVDRLEFAIVELESAMKQGQLLAHHLRAAKVSLQFATATLQGPGLPGRVAAEDPSAVVTPLNVRSSYVQDLLSRLLLARKSSTLDKSADTPRGDMDVNGAVAQTTVMLRDIPNNYSREMLLALLEREGFSKQVMNFLYYPIDFRLHAGLGYCFINFVAETDVHKFWSHFEGFSNWELPSRKIAHVSWALPLQGYEQCVGRYRNSQVMHHSVPDEFRPLLFKSGERIPFPAPTKTIRNPRYRRVRGTATTAA